MAVRLDVLAACDAVGRSHVLDALIDDDSTLASRAQAIARAHLEAVDVAQTISQVRAALLSLDQDDLAWQPAPERRATARSSRPKPPGS